MDIWEGDKLILFIAFVMPGFIAIKFYELLFPGEQKDSSEQIIDSVVYSSLTYALMLWPVLRIEEPILKSNHPNLYVLFYMFVPFVVPVLLVFIWKFLRTRRMFQIFGSCVRNAGGAWKKRVWSTRTMDSSVIPAE
jgi:hypothetical protein